MSPQIDGFRNLELIAHGGFAVVYRAVEVVTGRPVAIKILNKLDPAEERRFRRELDALELLSRHPNVVTVHGSGHTADGAPYLVLELSDGGSLKDALASGAFEVGDVAWIADRVLGALAAAHAKGIVHRDIKPSNILTGRGEALLADFGIARFSDASQTTASSLSTTVPYAAPETLNDGRATMQSDLFSLGATLYTLAVGRPLYESWQVALSAASHARPIDVSAAPTALQRWLSELLSVDPVDRPVSASEALASLRSLGVATQPSPRLQQHIGVADATVANSSDAPSELVPAPVEPSDESEPELVSWWRRPVAVVALISALFIVGGAGTAVAMRNADDPGSPSAVGEPSGHREGVDTTPAEGADLSQPAEVPESPGASDPDPGEHPTRETVPDPTTPQPPPPPAPVTDTDDDGVPDGSDGCPSSHGDGSPDGCPDADDDGVPDGSDGCPSSHGDGSPDGCPDGDEDGVSYGSDRCPGEPGSAAAGGCLDTDEDGVPDRDEAHPACVSRVGPASNGGCPARSGCIGSGPTSRAVDFDRSDGVSGDRFVANGCEWWIEINGSDHHILIASSQITLDHGVLLGYFDSDRHIDVFQRRDDGVWRVAFTFRGGFGDVQNSERAFAELSVCDVDRDGLDDIYLASRQEFSRSTGGHQRWAKWAPGIC